MPPRIDEEQQRLVRHSQTTGSLSSSYSDDEGYSNDNNNASDKYGAITATKNDIQMTMDEAIERLGYGKFQNSLLWATGLCMTADGLEVLLLSFLTLVLHSSDWDLTPRQTSGITSCVFLGALVGSIVLGRLADTKGRRPMFIATAGMIAVFGFATGFAPDYYTLVACRFLVGFGVGGLIVPFDTLAEFMPASHRGQSLLKIEYFWTAGSLLVVLCSYLTLGQSKAGPIDEDSTAILDIVALATRGFSNFWGAWRIFVIFCSLPCFVATVWGIFHVPESPRWLMSTKDDQAGALKVLRRAAEINGYDPYERFPENTQLLREGDHNSSENDNKTHFSEVLEMFGPRWLKTTMALWGCWLGFGLLYYGTVIAITIVFAGKSQIQHDEAHVDAKPEVYKFDYWALLIANAAEIFGTTIVVLTVDSWGRIKIQWVSYLVSGLSVLVMCLLAIHNDDNQYRIALVILAFGARMLTMSASCTTWVSTAEVLTTDIRATGHSAANAMARLGGFFCPYVVSPTSKLSTIGYAMFAIACFTSFCAFHIPETLGVNMGGNPTPTSDLEKEAKDERDGRTLRAEPV